MVPARPEQHNTATSGMPCRAAHPPPVRSLPKAAGSGQSHTAPASPTTRRLFSFARAHTQLLQFCQKQNILHGAHTQCLHIFQKP